MNKTVDRFSMGFSLVEVTIALGVAAFCLVALFGLLPIGLTSNQTSLEQTVAASMAASVVADLRATPVVNTSPASATLQTSPLFAIPIPTANISQMYTLFLREDGTMAQTVGATTSKADGWDLNPTQNSRYRVTLTFNPPPSGQLSVTPVRVLVTWPATADSKADNPPSKFSGSFETLAALDRN